MAQNKLPLQFKTPMSIINAPDTELKDIFLESLKLMRHDPSILNRIAADIDMAAKEKKALRLADQDWYDQLNGTLPGCESLCIAEQYEPDNLYLLDGRPRLLDPESVFLLMMCRAHLDSVTSRQAVDRLRDSILIQSYFESRNMRVPAPNTVLDTINAVTNETRDAIFKAQIKMIIQNGLDLMERVTMDSFSISGNTEWPTDSRILLRLLNRAYHIGRNVITKLGLPGFSQAHVSGWLKDLKKLDFEMSHVCGKPKSKKKLIQLYRKFLKRVNKILLQLTRQCIDNFSRWENLDWLPPSRRVLAQEAIDQIILDLEAVIRVYQYAGDRVFNGIILPAPEKVLSLSDESVSFIKKGQREAVIGYKPQVVRSDEGFITAFEVQQGNPADSARLEPVISQHCENTGTVPDTVSVDDGYSSEKNRKALKDMGINIVSIGGSKGKKITPDDEWDSPEYQEARNGRSAVESIVFVLRDKFHLRSFTRRGLERVNAELTEKVIAHNFWRIAYLRKKEKKLIAA